MGDQNPKLLLMNKLIFETMTLTLIKWKPVIQQQTKTIT